MSFSPFYKSQVTFTELKKIEDTTKAKVFKYDTKSDFQNVREVINFDQPEFYMKLEKIQKTKLNFYKQYIGYDIYFLGKPIVVERKATKNFMNSKRSRKIITKLYNPIYEKHSYGDFDDMQPKDIVNDSIKTYTSEYKLLEISYSAKDFKFDNERITYFEDSQISQQEDYFNYEDNKNSDVPIFKLLNKTTSDTVYVNDLNNVLFLPHFKYIKQELDGKELVYLTYKGEKGAQRDLYFNDLLTDERIVIKNSDILNSKIELLRNNVVYDLKNHSQGNYASEKLYYNRYSFYPFVVLTTENNKKFALSEESFFQIFNENGNRIVHYEDYLKEIEYSKLASIDKAKKIQNSKEKKQRDSVEKLKTLSAKYNERIANLIWRNEVEIGMTKQMCDESLGKSYEIKTLLRQGLKYEVGYYYGGYKLYFINNELKQIEY